MPQDVSSLIGHFLSVGQPDLLRSLWAMTSWC